jgi:bacterioferritin-associated ferredoxin
MYVCICARVRDCELRTAIRSGARTEDLIGDACGAGTSCGSCLDRICDMIDEECETADSLVSIAR